MSVVAVVRCHSIWTRCPVTDVGLVGEGLEQHHTYHAHLEGWAWHPCVWGLLEWYVRLGGALGCCRLTEPWHCTRYSACSARHAKTSRSSTAFEYAKQCHSGQSNSEQCHPALACATGRGCRGVPRTWGTPLFRVRLAAVARPARWRMSTFTTVAPSLADYFNSWIRITPLSVRVAIIPPYILHIFAIFQSSPSGQRTCILLFKSKMRVLLPCR
jgi:hypothetical protein